MAFIPCPNTIKAELLYQSDALTYAMNIIHVYSIDSSDPATLLGVANTIENWMYNTQAPGMANDWAAVSVRALNIEVADGAFAYSDLGHLPFHGTSLVGSTGFQVCGVVSLRTGLSGRSNRGRLYIPATRSDFVGDITLTGAGQSAYQANYQQLLDDLEANGTPWVIASFYHNGAPRPAGTISVVDLVQIPAKLGTQRRRLD